MKLLKILPVILITACTTSSKTPQTANNQDSMSETYTLEEARAVIKKEEEAKKAKNRENELLYERNKAIRNSWENYVIVSSDYQSVSLGGIKNLYVVLTNKLPFSINSLQVDVVYLKSNGGVYKIEKLEYENVPSGRSDTLMLDDTERGVKIQTEVRSLYSSRMNLCYVFPMRPDAIKDVNDPYRCK